MKDLKIVFMGTPNFSVPILEGLIEKYNVQLVVCQPDRNKDRKGKIIIPPTKQVALNHQIEVFQPEKIRTDYQKILEQKPDMIITCAYGQIIPKEIIDYPKYGCINVHGSLLPKLRGGAPIHWAIINGDKKTGITIMQMNEKMDAGDIISQKELEIGPDENLDSLYQRMSILGKELLLETIPNIISGNVIYQIQDETKVTFGYNIKKEDEKIDFSKTKEEIKNLVRGLSTVPGAYCYLEEKRMKIYEVDTSEKEINKYQNGEIIDIEPESIICKCSNGIIKIKDISIEGKKRCKVKDYLNGINKNKLIGKVLK